MKFLFTRMVEPAERFTRQTNTTVLVHNNPFEGTVNTVSKDFRLIKYFEPTKGNKHLFYKLIAGYVTST